MQLSEVLAEYPDVDIEAGKDLESVALAAKEFGRPGKVTVELKVTKVKNRVQVQASHQTKEPKPDAEIGLWHIGPDGLTKDDPYQGSFDPTTGEVREPRHARED